MQAAMSIYQAQQASQEALLITGAGRFMQAAMLV